MLFVISQAQIALAGSIIVVDGGLVFRKGLENSQKFYQPGGRTAYLRKQSYGYDVVVIDKNGKSIVSVVGGNSKNGVSNTLPDLSAVKRMLTNTGGYSTIPLD